jgi:hypothetical protein
MVTISDGMTLLRTFFRAVIYHELIILSISSMQFFPNDNCGNATSTIVKY